MCGCVSPVMPAGEESWVDIIGLASCKPPYLRHARRSEAPRVLVSNKIASCLSALLVLIPISDPQIRSIRV